MTDDDIRTIRMEYIDRKESWRSPNVMELANRYGVAQETIRKIAKGKSYKWVKDV